MSIILKTTNLCKSFSRQTVVNNISLNIEKNSVYGLLGPNGAGKSTTLKMITGILKPTSGSIEFDGHAWRRKDLNDIGTLIETPPLYENLTAFENLKVRTELLGLPDKRCHEALDIVGLTNTGKKRAGQFSLGMNQRLGIAIAILNNPRLLILDEPTAGLDPMGRDVLLSQIVDYHRQRNNTVLLVSHSMEDIARYADRLMVMNHGEKVFDGAPKDVFEHYKELEAIGLAAPQVTYITHALKEHGVPIGDHITTVEEARDAILKLLNQ